MEVSQGGEGKPIWKTLDMFAFVKPINLKGLSQVRQHSNRTWLHAVGSCGNIC